MSDIFKRVREAGERYRYEEKQLTFQERIVKRLLNYANVPYHLPTLRREAEERTGYPDLGFRWFNDAYPAFPVVLLSEKMTRTHTATLGDLYGKSRFTKLPWWQEYLTQADTYGVDLKTQRAALLFNLPYAKDAFLMVLHNQPVQNQVVMAAEHREEDPWPRTTFPMKTGVTAVLEAFPSFMQTVGKDWAIH